MGSKRDSLPDKLKRFVPRLFGALRFGVTRPGWALSVGVIAAGVAGAYAPTVAGGRLLMTLVCFYVLVLLLGIIFRPRVTVSAEIPSKAMAGNTITGRFAITNTSFIPAYDVSLQFPSLPDGVKAVGDSMSIRRIGAGETISVDIQIELLRRGVYELVSPWCFSTFPLNLFRMGRRSGGCRSLVVLPRFHSVAMGDTESHRRYHPGGIALTSNVGESPEYLGNREYRPGDSLKRIDAKAWGRLGQPIVREYHQEYFRQIALVLDTHIPLDRSPTELGFADLEAAISLAAGISESVSDGESVLDIFAIGANLQTLQAGRHVTDFEHVLEVLAELQPNREDMMLAARPSIIGAFGSMSSAVFILLDWDPIREQLVRVSLDAGCSVRVVIIRDGQTSYPLVESKDCPAKFMRVDAVQVEQGRVCEL